jgi:hypothetical protein
MLSAAKMKNASRKRRRRAAALSFAELAPQNNLS